ncbi:MAG: chemotaxis protein CheW [Phycisphaerales bacterium]|nr:chemotaxis protein CheW [Phycisphaerales bacterium]
MNSSIDHALNELGVALTTPLDRNDLGRLARMHTLGQTILETLREEAPDARPPSVTGLTEQLVNLLERIILDEAADPALGLMVVPEVCAALTRLFANDPVDCGALHVRITAAIGDGTPALDLPVPTADLAEPPVPPLPTDVVVHSPPPATLAEAQTPVAEVPAPTNQQDPEPYVAEPLLIDLQEREHVDGFLEESVEHMEAIEAGLLDLESDPGNTTRINELFRPFHTIKGIAGFLNLRDINRLTHELETLLDLGRRSELQITQPIVDLIFAGVDALKVQLREIRAYMAAPTGTTCPQPEIAALIQRLRLATRPGGPPTATVSTSAPPQTAPITPVVSTPSERSAGSTDTAQQTAAKQGADQALIDNSIRVDTRKLDLLVDAVGELVIAQSMVGLVEAQLGSERLHRNVAQVTKIVRDVQETAMAMRMVPIGHTFQKMRRLVRDVARKAGKSVELIINGEETELDKTVIQQISDPLVHMVRNAVDHGLENTEGRVAAGKSTTGQVTLNAYHQGDSIVIEVRDDGRGLDPQKLIAKGIERGLVSSDDQLSDQQAFALILQPGFSTAEKVTDISGRGVGMDVVKRNIDKLRGKIEIHSQLGTGSTFRIRLPLTLAIIDGMLVRVGSERMIIPTILIEQSLKPAPQQVSTVQRRGALLQVRGELIPIVQLGALFHQTPPIDPSEHLAVIVWCEGYKVALVVDELIGQQQVVIKTLGERFKRVRGVSGAAILGDGRVGIILEPTGILALHNEGARSGLWAPAEPPAAAPFSSHDTNSGDAAGTPSPNSRAERPAELVPA